MRSSDALEHRRRSQASPALRLANTSKVMNTSACLENLPKPATLGGRTRRRKGQEMLWRRHVLQVATVAEDGVFKPRTLWKGTSSEAKARREAGRDFKRQSNQLEGRPGQSSCNQSCGATAMSALLAQAHSTIIPCKQIL